MTKIVMIILNVFLVILMIGFFSIFFAFIRTKLGGLFGRTGKLDRVENRSILSSIISFILALILLALLILALDSFFWPLRSSVIGWSADKIEKATGVKKTEKPFGFKLEK